MNPTVGWAGAVGAIAALVLLLGRWYLSPAQVERRVLKTKRKMLAKALDAFRDKDTERMNEIFDDLDVGPHRNNLD